ncbi:histidine phosphatase family protein [Haploplasma axanthum]|uniref:Alpha-ribazole phosphatase n=1 Tax=Haploplasma axanthum TaxID=29552 RepID=A0A449BEC9_HAPAX|nr:histidine phosphatase family protein [Haploplasma axanthum]VEU80813.1 Alpha-ribazole phosphatase [Haploplasma axanthum]
MKIYLVRHGQTNYNSQRLIQGRVDAPLNNVGQKQAKTAGQKLKSLGVTFDRVVSSPLSRALETGYLISKKINYKGHILIEPNFVERDFGNYELTKIADNFPKVMVEGFSEVGFEDNEQIRERIAYGLVNLYNRFPDETIVLTTHAHAIRTVYLLFDNKKYTYTNFFLGNGSIHLFEFDGKKLNLIETYLNEEEQ